MLTTKTKKLSLIVLSVMMAVALALGIFMPMSSKAVANDASLFTGLIDAAYSEVEYSASWSSYSKTKKADAITTNLPDQANAITYNNPITLTGGEQSIVRFGITGAIASRRLNHGILTFRLTDANNPSVYAEFRVIEQDKGLYLSASNSANVDNFAAVSNSGSVTKYSGRTSPSTWSGAGAIPFNSYRILPAGEFLFNATEQTVTFRYSTYDAWGEVGEIEFADFKDTANQLSNAWGGFTSNQVVLTIFGETGGIWTGSGSAKLAIESVGGKTVVPTLFSNLSNASYGSVSFTGKSTTDDETFNALNVDLNGADAPIKYNREIDIPTDGGALQVARLGGWSYEYDLHHFATNVKVADAFDDNVFFEVRITRNSSKWRYIQVRNNANADGYASKAVYYGDGKSYQGTNLPLNPTKWADLGPGLVDPTALGYVELIYLKNEVIHGIFALVKDTAYSSNEIMFQVADFNDTSIFANAWSGFATGKVKISIYGTTPNGFGHTTTNNQLSIVSLGGVPACAEWANAQTKADLEYGYGELNVTGLKQSYNVGDKLDINATFTANGKTVPAYVKVYAQNGKITETGACTLTYVCGYDIFFYAEVDGKLLVESKSIIVLDKAISGASDVAYEEVAYAYGTNERIKNALTMTLTGKDEPITIGENVVLGSGDTSLISFGAPGNISQTYPLGYGMTFVKVSDANNPSVYFEVRIIQRDSQLYVSVANDKNVDKFGGQAKTQFGEKYSKDLPRNPSGFNTTMGAVFIYSGSGYSFGDLIYNKTENKLYFACEGNKNNIGYALADFADTTNQFANAWTGFANTSEVSISIWGENCTYFSPSTTAQKLAIETIGGKAVNQSMTEFINYGVNPTLEVGEITDVYVGDEVYAEYSVFNATAYYGKNSEWYYDAAISYEWLKGEQVVSTNAVYVPADSGAYALRITAKDATNNVAVKTINFTVNAWKEPLVEIADITAKLNATLNAEDYVTATAFNREYEYAPEVAYAWYFGGEIVCGVAEFTPIKAGEYTLTVTATDDRNIITEVEKSFTVTAVSFVETVTDKAVSIRAKSQVNSGLRFETTFNKAQMDALLAKVGAEVKAVSYGTFITPLDHMGDASVFTLEELAKQRGKEVAVEDVDYIDVTVDAFYAPLTTETTYAIRGSIVDIKEHNFCRKFVGVGYVKVTLNDDTVEYYYSEYNASAAKSIYDISKLAFADRSDVQEELYEYEVFEGSYSKLNEVSFPIVQHYVDSVVSITADGEIQTGIDADIYTAPYTVVKDGNTITITSTCKIKSVIVDGVLVRFTASENGLTAMVNLA